MIKLKVVFLVLCISINSIDSQNSISDFNWRSGKDFRNSSGLPDPFLRHDGTRVKSKEEWHQQREYIKALLEHYQYGEMPPVPKDIIVAKTFSGDFYNGLATKKLYTLTIKRNNTSLNLHFGLIKPKGDGPFPIIIKNDRADHIINKDIDRMSIPEDALIEAINRGYSYCVYNREDIGSDIGGKYDENRNNGVFLLFPEYNWGTIAAWAWGYKLLIDFFKILDFIDKDKIIVTGHSRGGKAAFCGGIFDERISITAPNSSGLGGTSSHLYYELVARPQQHIIDNMISFPHWWSAEYYKLAGFESRVPFDSHFGKIAIAPRGFFNTHAYQDYWANPFGAWLTSEAAKKVYEWLGSGDNIAMNFRSGGHAQNLIDWFALLDFCDYYFYNKSPLCSFDINYDFINANPYPWAKIPVNWTAPQADQ